MSDNLDIPRLTANPTSTEAVNWGNDTASHVDGRFSVTLTVDVGSDNTATLTRDQLKSVHAIQLNEGDPATSDTISIFVNNGNGESPEVNVPLGSFTVINNTANSARFYLLGGSSPSGSGLIAAGVGTAGGDAAAQIDVLADDVVSVGGGGGGGGAAPVSSVFGRTGAVTAQAGDYTAKQVSFADPISGSPPLDDVYEALAYLLSNPFGGGGGGGVSWSLTTVDLGALGASNYDVDVTGASDVLLMILGADFGASTEAIKYRFSTDGGSTFKSGASDYLYTFGRSDTDAVDAVRFSDISSPPALANTNAMDGQLSVRGNGPAAPLEFTAMTIDTVPAARLTQGMTSFVGPITHVRMFSNSANFSAGTLYVLTR